MDSKLLDEHKLLEVLELAKVGEQKMKKVSEGLILTIQCENWYQEKQTNRPKHEGD